MSQIFDALHQSASERAGNGSRDFSAAKELLQVVERKSGSSAAVLDAPQSVIAGKLPQFTSAKVALPEDSKFVCFSHSESLAAEKFRFLATRLRHLQQKRSIKRLVITSSVSGEGKSIVASNLASALAGGKQQQVLLVEGDLRRPSLASQLGLRELPGLSQVLRNGGDAADNIFRLDNTGLCVLLAGEAHNNPLEFMDAGKLSAILDRTSVGFDWVVIDSPPVLPLADTSMWMRLADAILLVMRPGVTSKKQLQRTYDAIEQSKLIGSVLNASSEITANHYYYQYTAHPGGPKTSDVSAK